jgi:hypothetical protein
MSALRLRQYILAFVAGQDHEHRATTETRGRELRLLQRRLAAARLGISAPRQAVREPLYEDLR